MCRCYPKIDLAEFCRFHYFLFSQQRFFIDRNLKYWQKIKKKPCVFCRTRCDSYIGYTKLKMVFEDRTNQALSIACVFSWIPCFHFSLNTKSAAQSGFFPFFRNLIRVQAIPNTENGIPTQNSSSSIQSISFCFNSVLALLRNRQSPVFHFFRSWIRLSVIPTTENGIQTIELIQLYRINIFPAGFDSWIPYIQLSIRPLSR